MQTLQDQDTKAEIKTIQTWAMKCYEKPEDTLLTIEKGIFQAIKDHNNGAVQKMVKKSNQFFAAKYIAENVKDMTKKEVKDKFGYAADTQAPEDTKFQLPCRLILLNENQYGEKLREILTPEKPNAWARTSVPIFVRELPPSPRTNFQTI